MKKRELCRSDIDKCHHRYEVERGGGDIARWQAEEVRHSHALCINEHSKD